MRFDRTVRLIGIALVAAHSAVAASPRFSRSDAAFTPARSGKIDYTLSFAATYDSNIFARRDSAGDFSTSSYFNLRQQRVSSVNTDISLGLQVGKFFRLAGEDFLNPSLEAGLSTVVRKMELRWNSQVSRSQRAETLTGSRLDFWQEQSSLTLAKIALAGFQGTAAGEFARTRYANREGADLRTEALSLGLQRPLVRGRVFNLVLRTSRDTTQTTGQARDFTASTGLSEQLFPKVTGRISVGSQTRRTSFERDPSTVLTTSAELAWNATNSTSVTQTLERGIRTNVIGGSQLDLSHHTAIRQRIYTGWTGMVSYRRSRAAILSAAGAIDRSQSLSFGIARDLGNNLSLTLQTSWTANRSGLSSTADFVRRTATLNILRKW